MTIDSVSITVAENDSVVLSASRAEEMAALEIRTAGTSCEIRMDRATVYALRDQLPGALAGLDQWSAETQACVTAAGAQQRAIDAVTRAQSLLAAAERAGDTALAARLRTTMSAATATASAVDAAVTAFEEATTDADSATTRLTRAISEAETQLRQAPTS